MSHYFSRFPILIFVFAFIISFPRGFFPGDSGAYFFSMFIFFYFMFDLQQKSEKDRDEQKQQLSLRLAEEKDETNRQIKIALSKAENENDLEELRKNLKVAKSLMSRFELLCSPTMDNAVKDQKSIIDKRHEILISTTLSIFIFWSNSYYNDMLVDFCSNF